ncbi:MAG: ribosome maturation factor RimM [Lachnospiraceae bacterium]|nr:ribosome maturation factor RimM [Lachnospiraceae bacterium]
MEEFFRVGVFSSTHGVHGEFKVFPTTDDVRRFDDLDSIIMEKGNKRFTAKIENVKYFKQFAILKIEGYDTLNDIEPLKGSELWITREQAEDNLAEDEYFIADIIGAKVLLEDKTEFGVLKDVILTGANDVYEVVDKNGKEWYLPVIDDCVKDVNVEDGEITVCLLPGLEDL